MLSLLRSLFAIVAYVCMRIPLCYLALLILSRLILGSIVCRLRSTRRQKAAASNKEYDEEEAEPQIEQKIIERG